MNALRNTAEQASANFQAMYRTLIAATVPGASRDTLHNLRIECDRLNSIADKAWGAVYGAREYKGQSITSHPNPTFNEYLKNHPVTL